MIITAHSILVFPSFLFLTGYSTHYGQMSDLQVKKWVELVADTARDRSHCGGGAAVADNTHISVHVCSLVPRPSA